MRLGHSYAVKIDVIPTGALSLDLALGWAGSRADAVRDLWTGILPAKHSELHSLRMRKKGGLAAFIDAEHALDPGYAKKLGVNLDDLLVSQPDSGERL